MFDRERFPVLSIHCYHQAQKHTMGIQGIIRPPTDIRAVADKTASFVAKNGRAFEARIVNSAKGKTPKFAFLHESSPFHAYYESKILFYQNGGVDDEKEENSDNKDELTTFDGAKEEQNPLGDSTVQDTGKGVTTSPKIVVSRQVKSHLDPVAKALLKQRVKIEEIKTSKCTTSADESKSDTELKENERNEYTDVLKLKEPSYLFTRLVAPRYISPVQLEIIKTTAQFAVLNSIGGSFLRDLTLKEWNNPLFEFLQPRHAYYAYFSQLVDLYRHILQISVIALESAEKEVKKEKVLSTSFRGPALHDVAKMKKLIGLDHGTTDYPDKHDQSIELIAKTAGNIQNCLEHIAYCSEYNRYFEEQRIEQENKNSDGKLHGAALVDWYDFVVVETIEFTSDESVEISKPNIVPASEREIDKMDESDEEEIQVVSDYRPKVVSSQSKLSSESRTHVIDPITGKLIPIEDTTEHMRIQLLDPKWAAEKAKFLETQKESNLVRGDLIAKNINALLGTSVVYGKSGIEGDQLSHKDSQIQQVPTVKAPAVHTSLPNHVGSPVDTPVNKRARTENYPSLQQPLVINHLPAFPANHLESERFIDEIDHSSEVSRVILSEEDFVMSLQKRDVKLNIFLPRDTSNISWNLHGQTISIDVDVMSSVKAVKEYLQTQLGGMPVSKIQLKSPGMGFLKDSLSLAYLNIGPESNLELVPKVRGGRR